MEKGQFPDALKQARVIPLHKGGNNQEMTNWRLISILPLFSNFLKKTKHGRLHRYLESLGLLCNTQFEFRKGHSTTHTMHHLVGNIKIAFESGKVPLTIFY